MNIKEIKELLQLIDKSNLTEFKLETDDVKLTIRTKDYHERKSTTYIQSAPESMPIAPAMAMAAPAPAEKAAPKAEEPTVEYLEIRSPIVGTFYRAPAPDKPQFVKVGDHVNKGDVVCIVEAMKLFNDIESEVSGKIVKVMVDDASPVEYDQVLFLVDPNG
ncbi:MAG TPA: acetyl-CoA carboxylase biotin carboxyl carrier protein [Saprospiraceae bacterium]|nr:acetyl-CoA carboxylase biotin carboxyl carrier protein [Saprospiraceae bacterium]